jgi:hypothetical protein
VWKHEKKTRMKIKSVEEEQKAMIRKRMTGGGE